MDVESIIREKNLMLQKATLVIEQLKRDFENVVHQLENKEEWNQEQELKQIKQLLIKEENPQFKQPLPQIFYDQICYKEELIIFCNREQQFINMLNQMIANVQQCFQVFTQCFEHPLFVQLEQIIRKYDNIESYLNNSQQFIDEEFSRIIFENHTLNQHYKQLLTFLPNNDNELITNEIITQLQAQYSQIQKSISNSLICINKQSDEIIVLKTANKNLLSTIETMQNQQNQNQQIMELFEQSLIDLEEVTKQKENQKRQYQYLEQQFKEYQNQMSNMFQDLLTNQNNVIQYSHIHPYFQKMAEQQKLQLKNKEMMILTLKQIAQTLLQQSENTYEIRPQDLDMKQLLKCLFANIKKQKQFQLLLVDILSDLTIRWQNSNINTKDISHYLHQIKLESNQYK